MLFACTLEGALWGIFGLGSEARALASWPGYPLARGERGGCAFVLCKAGVGEPGGTGRSHHLPTRKRSAGVGWGRR